MHLIDEPNERSTHSKFIPLGAGIGFISSMLIGLILYDSSIVIEYWYVFVSIIIVLCVGILDDVYYANPKMKIYAISLAVIILWLNNISIISLGIYLNTDMSLGWLSLPFTLFALVTFTNSMNLIDGIDGLAALVSVVIITFLGYLGYQHSQYLVMLISLFTIASISSFILLNYHPAKVFMGDSGSLTLGFIISVLALLSLDYIHPVALLFLTALPLYDTLNVVIRRIKKRKPIFQPDNTHTHHMLLRFIGDKNEYGEIINGNRRTVWILIIFQITLSSIGMMINHYIPEYATLSLVSFFIFILIFLGIYMLFTKLDNY